MRFTLTFAAFMAAISVFSQSGTIKGRVIDNLTNEPVPFSNVALQETTYGAVSDIDGNYEITGIEPGLYNVQASFVGYKTKTIFEVEVFASNPTVLEIPLEGGATNLAAVEITTEVFERNAESPVSLQQIGANEIQRNPGGNRDISRALQILPGVASSLSFRNDIIIRGGAPNENRFFLDGIEVPVINHFATQGSSGGPVGILNVNFIQNVDFYSGAFPANRGNALSAVLEFTQKDGNTEGLKGNFTLSATDVGLTLDGPLGEKTTFIASVRRSYLQFLFGVIGLPFLPTYNDAQFKVKHRINEKNEITFIGLGAYDQFELNKGAAEDAETPEEKQEIDYVLANLPVNNQWNYTVGANYKHFSNKGFQNLILSRSHLNNQAEKYEQNIEIPQNLILNYESEEIENKFRLEHTQRTNGWKLNAGFNLEDVTYTNSTFNQISVDTALRTIDFNSEINFQRFGFFGSINRSFLEERLLLSFGLRTDWNNWAESMSNPIDQLSPRFSLSYSITPELSFQANVGRYYQLPPYTVLGFRDNEGDLVNKDNGVSYIQSDHFVAGLKYIFPSNTKVSVEGFYKIYDNYPFATRDSINLANLGADFGVVGNEEVVSIGQGRAYGVEFLIQRKLYNGLFGIAALTLVRSEFTDKNGDFVPSSWDNQFILSLTAGKKFGKNWEAGTRVQVLGGPPFTPVDAETSSLIPVWNVNNRGLPDNNRLNQERAPVSYQVDFRIDKKYFFDKWSLNLYLDIENITNAVVELEPFIDVVRNESGQPEVDPSDSSRYLLTTIPNTSGTLLPSIGVVVEF
ncbi:MAG: hypothetical protein ACI9CP_001427 [Cryomorphaceae bacterium]|jgi:hypothetical protein